MKNCKLFFCLTAFCWITTTNACTNFLVGKTASVDGSTMISYSADSYWLYGALYHQPAAVYPKNTQLKVYEWDTGKYLGTIAQARQTYNVIGNINEHQVAIGETTFTGREELIDTTGILDYGSLIYIALQRAKTAREAIKIMTDLVAQYGYYSSGESFSIADPNEVWIMEMIGKGPGRKGAVWVALRIPDNCISAHANQARITKIPFRDSYNCLYSPDVVEFAREKGYYSGSDENFSFSDTYNPLDFGGLRFCEARVWSFFRQVSSATDRFISYINGETRERLPLWVKPDKRLSVDDIKNMMRDHYEGTPLDMTRGAGSGAFGSPFRNSPLSYFVDSVEYFHERPTATQQTGFSFVAQMRRWLPNSIGGILWFGVDDASTGFYTPIYCCTNKVPLCFDMSNGNMFEVSWTSAFWINNWVASMVYNRYSDLIQTVKTEQKKWDIEFKIALISADVTALEIYERGQEADVSRYLTTFSIEQAQSISASWKTMGEQMMIKYLDGVVKGTDENGNYLQNNLHIPGKIIRPGYSEEYNRKEFVTPDPDRFRMRSQKEMEERW
ncbi:MAG: C69 family dipeptidase [Prevotellaceae bacterium]|jgi:dipeptidase|nr:C69 family dipeptidase [Prevotellaceae bacterium]